MSQNDISLITWIDAHAGNEGGWYGLDPDDKSEYINQTVGFVVHESDGGKPNHMTIAQSISQEGLYDHVIHIPAIMVRTVTFHKPYTKGLTV